MAFMTIQDPSLASAFQALSGAFTGNPSALIQADLDKKRAAQILADTARVQAETSQINSEQDNLAKLQSIFGSPNLDLTDPRTRAAIAAATAGMKDGLHYGPSASFGDASFINPQFLPNDADFSRAAIGTGAVSSYDQTPAGDLAKLQNALTMNQQDNQTALTKNQQDNQTRLDIAKMKPAGTRAGTLPLVSPKTAEDIASAMDAALSGAFGKASIDPGLRAALQVRATQLYQQTRNVPVAIQQAIEEAGAHVEGQRAGHFSLNPADWVGSDGNVVGSVPEIPIGDNEGTEVPGAPDEPEAPAVAAAPALAAAAPATPAGPVPLAPVKGKSAPQQVPPDQLPAAAKLIKSDGKGGYFIMQGGKAVPIPSDGTVSVTSPSTKQTLTFRDGQWWSD